MTNSQNSIIKTCLIGGLCLSSLHLMWILLVLVGWAEPLMNFVFMLHMLNSPFQVQPFRWGLALGLLAITFAFGAFFGLVIYWIKCLFIPKPRNGFIWYEFDYFLTPRYAAEFLKFLWKTLKSLKIFYIQAYLHAKTYWAKRAFLTLSARTSKKLLRKSAKRINSCERF